MYGSKLKEVRIKICNQGQISTIADSYSEYDKDFDGYQCYVGNQAEAGPKMVRSYLIKKCKVPKNSL